MFDKPKFYAIFGVKRDKMMEKLSASLEDYLEAIYQISRDKSAARSKDIAERLGVSRSSVTGALHSLAERKLVNYTPYDIITLTPAGETIAARITSRHTLLCDFFARVLGVDAAEAEESACKMEHALSENIFDRLAQFVDFIRICPRLDIQWIQETGYFCERPKSADSCRRCISRCLDSLTERNATDAHNTE
jgi:DtxR family Mn-dependent transcriptional regulator